MLYLNDGTGSFIRSPGGGFGGSGENDFDYTVALAAFDADGDGDLDLAEGLQGWCWEHDVTNPNCGGGGINVLFNDGAGVFTSGHSVSGWTTDFAAADFDADGDVDLAAANIPDDGFNDTSFEPNLLFLNDGTGRFMRVPSAAFEAAPAGSVVSLDADGDGAADILLNTTLYRSKLAEGACIALADAGFRLADDVDFGEFRVLASFDADGDGDADLVGSRQQRDVLYLNDGAGGFYQSNAGELDDLSQRTSVLAAFDADQDGDLDLAVGNGDWEGPQADALFLNDGTGIFDKVEAGAFDDPVTVTWGLAAFDADGDGDPDLAAGGSGPEALYLNDGHGAFAVAASGDWASSDFNVLDLVAFDADGDGDGDLMPATLRYWPRPTTMLYRNDGHGVFIATDPGAAGIMEGAGAIAVLDADRDGAMDVVMGTNGLYGGLRDALLLNDGTGRFVLAPSLLDLRRETDDVGAFDVEGDGDLDVVATSEYGWGYGTVLLLNDGAGHLTPADGGDFEAAQGKVVFLDADRDGDTDIFAKDRLYANEVLYETGSATSPVIAPQELYPNGNPLIGWDRLQVTESLINQTTITYDVLNPTTGRPIPGFAACGPMRPGRLAWRASMRPGSGPSSFGPI